MEGGFADEGVGGGISGGGIVSTACYASSVEPDAPSVNSSVKGWSQSGSARTHFPGAFSHCWSPKALGGSPSVDHTPSTTARHSILFPFFRR